MSLPAGLIPFGPDSNCTLELCPLEASILQYQPSIPANSLFIGIFAISMVIHTAQGLWSRTWGFMASIISGCVLEIVGYVGRVIMHDNPFDFSGFLIQIICITIAPVFFCAAIYVLLSQVITHIDPKISRFDQRLYYWAFIPCDIVSLILQATGGAISCVSTSMDDIKQGEDISIGGLIFQVITLGTFCLLFVDYIIGCLRSPSRSRLTPRMRTFLGLLLFSTILILLRCVYRIIELQKGYFSELFRNEQLFIALESSIMCVAVLVLNIGHPGMVSSRQISKSSRESSMDELSGITANMNEISMRTTSP